MSTDKFENLAIYKSYEKSPYASLKHASYFSAYEELLHPYRGKPLLFVEIGVLNGGSLFMWRDYFGPKARIIGVDLNPDAKRWEKDGFEIFIGSQSDPEFWKTFFEKIGSVDVVLDDGGHRFEQQIVTAHHCIPNIKDGGLLIVEDTHTSYFREFGYPTRYSFIEWTKVLIDAVNSRFPGVGASKLDYKNKIYSITIFESIVCFKVQPSRCYANEPTHNGKPEFAAQDYRYMDSSSLKTMKQMSGHLAFLKNSATARAIKDYVFSKHAARLARLTWKRLGMFSS